MIETKLGYKDISINFEIILLKGYYDDIIKKINNNSDTISNTSSS